MSTPQKYNLNSVNWLFFDKTQAYLTIVKAMASHAHAIRHKGAPEAIWVLEHDPVYTGGTSASDSEIIVSDGTPVIRVGRGGQWTWHGPGQRVIYVMMDLKKRGCDVRELVYELENWIIKTLRDFGVFGTRRRGLPGIWVRTGTSQSGFDKIGAIGIRISRWVCWHGISINLNPDLKAFDAIVPCGVADSGTTSLESLGIMTTMENLDNALIRNLPKYFQLP